MTLTHLVYTVPGIAGKPHSVHGVVSTARPVRLSLSLDQPNEVKPIDGLQGTVGLTGCGWHASTNYKVEVVQGTRGRQPH